VSKGLQKNIMELVVEQVTVPLLEHFLIQLAVICEPVGKTTHTYYAVKVDIIAIINTISRIHPAVFDKNILPSTLLSLGGRL
jgi:hypothetical protein